jgi:hypothetical protein
VARNEKTELIYSFSLGKKEKQPRTDALHVAVVFVLMIWEKAVVERAA